MSGYQHEPPEYYMPDEDFQLMESLYIQTLKQERKEAEYLLNNLKEKTL
jgi:hypothetical protein